MLGIHQHLENQLRSVVLQVHYVQCHHGGGDPGQMPDSLSMINRRGFRRADPDPARPLLPLTGTFHQCPAFLPWKDTARYVPLTLSDVGIR